MTDKNIILTGFMGCGKTMTSNKLASMLKRSVVSTDSLIERKENRSIEAIFKESGEAYFRKVEKDAVREAANLKSYIVDCGGGVILVPENMAMLKKNGIIFYLKASVETIMNNIQGQANRPLLNVADPKAKVAELLKARERSYEYADYIINADGCSVDSMANDIIKVLNNE